MASTSLQAPKARRATAPHRARAQRRAAPRAAAAAAAPWKERTARLALEDGSVWPGVSFGASGTQVGEVVFNTSLTGYQEILSDPSYFGQFVVFTAPHIGNTGVNADDMESGKVHLGAIACRKLSKIVSNYRSTSELSDWLAERGVMGVEDLDTRAITRRVRETGCLVGVLTTDVSKTDEELVEEAKSWSLAGKDSIAEVTCKEAYTWQDPTIAEWEFSRSEAVRGEKDTLKLVTYDFGIKTNILRRFASFGCEITVVPAATPAEEVLAMNPDGVFLSNGPGDPSAVPYAVENTKEIIGKVPLFGICMGHQVLGQAMGSSTFKLPFGHHGGNHPVRHNETGRVDICAHNHNYAVDPEALPKGVEVTHINLNDGTVSGMRWADKMAMSIQYHPESSPGPHDADVEFEEFVRLMKEHKASQ